MDDEGTLLCMSHHPIGTNDAFAQLQWKMDFCAECYCYGVVAESFPLENEEL